MKLTLTNQHLNDPAKDYQFVVSKHTDIQAAEENLQRTYKQLDNININYQQLSQNYQKKKQYEMEQLLQQQIKKPEKLPEYIQQNRDLKFVKRYYHPGKIQNFDGLELWSCCLREGINAPGCQLRDEKLK